MESSLRKAITFIDKKRRNKQYHSLEDKTEVALGARISHVQQRNTGFYKALKEDYMCNASFGENNKPSSDLQLFVQSLSKCIEVTKFGLSFGSEDLSFHPKRSASRYCLRSQDTLAMVLFGELWARQELANIRNQTLQFLTQCELMPHSDFRERSYRQAIAHRRGHKDQRLSRKYF